MNTSILQIPVSEGLLHVAVYGTENQIPVVLLHGTAAYHYCWRNVAAQLSAKYRVYCPDLLGAGFSDKPTDVSYSKQAQSARIQSLIQSLDCGPVHLVGHSIGGEIAVNLTLEAPELISSLTLVAPDGFRRGVAAPIKWAARRGWMNPIFRKAMSKPINPKALARILGIPLQHITPELVEHWTKPYADPNLPYIIAKTLADDDTGTMSHQVNRITAPTLLIYGTKDRLIPRRVFEKYKLALTNKVVEEYDGLGHVLMEQCPERLAASIDNFIL